MALPVIAAGQTDWLLVAENEQAKFYLAAERINRTPSGAVVWIEGRHTKPQPSGAGGKVTYVRSLNNYDIRCKDETMQSLRYIEYNSKGVGVYSWDYAGLHSPVVPDTIGEAVLRSTCFLIKQ